VDIDPIKLNPNWSNNILEEDCVSKRLYGFDSWGFYIEGRKVPVMGRI